MVPDMAALLDRDPGFLCIFSFLVFSISFLFTLMVLPTQSMLHGQKFCQSWRVIIIIHPQGKEGVYQYHCFHLCLDSSLLSVPARSTNTSLSNMSEIVVGSTPACCWKQCSHTGNSKLVRRVEFCTSPDIRACTEFTYHVTGAEIMHFLQASCGTLKGY